MLGLGSLIARVAAVAVIPRVVKALSALGGAKETYWTNPVEPVKETVSAPVQLPEKVLYGRSLPTAHKYRYCGNNPMGLSDAEGLQPGDGTDPSSEAMAMRFRGMMAGLSAQNARRFGISLLEFWFTFDAFRSVTPNPFALENTAMRASAGQMFRDGRQGLTVAGRAALKHPNIIGVAGNAVKVLGGVARVNEAAATALEKILAEGARTTKCTKAYGKVIDYTLASGLGARFKADTLEFIGFLGRGL